MNTITTIIKKELKRFFTDPRMVSSIILPGLLLFLIYSLLGNVIHNEMFPEKAEYNVVVINKPSELEDIYKGLKVNELEDISYETALEMIENKELDLFIIYDENFFKNIENKIIPNIEIFYNSTDTNSFMLYEHTISALDKVEDLIANAFDVNNKENVIYDLGVESEIFKDVIGMILPFILIILLFSGAMSICVESISGEKERGTMATLLVTPAKRSHIVVGKVVALGLTTIVAALASFIGLITSLPKLMGTDFSFELFSVGTIALILTVVVVTALLFTTILSIISAYAKSVKEANGLAMPLMVLISMLGISGMIGNKVSDNMLIYLIPVYNSIQCFSTILSGSVNVFAFLITIGTNILYISLGVLLLSKMFESERIIFNK